MGTAFSRGRLLTGVVAVGVAAVLFVGGGLAFAEGNNKTFYACEKDGNLIAGSLSVDTAPECNGTSTLIEWNQQGLPGADGENGAPGPAGPVGPPGTGGGFGDFYAAFTLRITNDGCAAGEFKLDYARTWGEELPPLVPTLPEVAGLALCQPIFGDGASGFSWVGVSNVPFPEVAGIELWWEQDPSPNHLPIGPDFPNNLQIQIRPPELEPRFTPFAGLAVGDSMSDLADDLATEPESAPFILWSVPPTE